MTSSVNGEIKLGLQEGNMKPTQQLHNLGQSLVLGGGNAKHIKHLPPDTRMGDNRNAFVGGSRLWEKTTKPFGGDEKKPTAKRRR